MRQTRHLPHIAAESTIRIPSESDDLGGIRRLSSRMRVTYDADAAYIYLTDEELMPGRESVPVDPPEGMHAMVVLDWNDGRIAGLEVLDAAALLHQDRSDERCPRGNGTRTGEPPRRDIPRDCCAASFVRLTGPAPIRCERRADPQQDPTTPVEWRGWRCA